MKKLSLLLIVLFTMFVVGCANDKEENENVNNDVNNNQNEENNENQGTNQAETNSGVMELGETGFVDNGINKYEITPKSVEIFRERNDISTTNDDEVFALIDYTIKNISEEAFNEEDILVGAGLFLKNSQGDEVTEISYYDYDFVAEITESIEPGESYDSQLLFEIPVSESSEYTLQFGSYSPDVEDAEWFFTINE